MAIYVDTSALAKRYVDEVESEQFDAFVAQHPDVLHICPLTVTEFQSVLMRRQRMGEFGPAYVENARNAFASDLASGVWQWDAFPAAALGHASRLIQDIAMGLATLDALHLACAQLLQCNALATADVRLARAASQLGLAVHRFAH